MLFHEYLQTLKPYVAPSATETEYFVVLFDNCLEEKGNEIIDGYRKTQRHYLYTGEREAGFFASKIFAYFEEERFTDWLLDTINEEMVDDLKHDFRKFDVTIDEWDWDKSLARLFKEVLKEAKSKIRSTKIQGGFKIRALCFEENPNGICPCQNCSNPLKLYVNLERESAYQLEAIYLDPNGPKSIANAIGICAECFQENTYDLNTLCNKKKEFLRLKKTYEEFDDPLFPERLIEAVSKLKASKPNELITLSYKALKINKKILPDNHVLLSDIEEKVARFFPFLLECFSEDDGTDGYSYEGLSKSIRALFESASKQCVTQDEIFDLISKKIAAEANANENTGRVIAAYFVQTCEVFNEIPK